MMLSLQGRTPFSLLMVLALCVSFLVSSAADSGVKPEYASAQELIAAVTREAADAYTLTCDVLQEKHLSMLASPVVFTGRMSLRRPDRLRWEFTSPIPSVFIINGSRVIRCVQGAAPMEIDINASPALKQATAQMLAWVSGDFESLAGMFRMRLASKGTGLVLEPLEHDPAAGIRKITVMFQRATLCPKTVRIDEQGGDWTKIVLSNYRINTVIPEGAFDGCRP